MFLPYLNVKGYTIEALWAASEQRVDGWMNQYMNMLEGCLGHLHRRPPWSG
jgi:hypothetical protein